MRIIEIANILKDHPNLKHKFQDLLPELIRKLIKETSSSIAYNRFPSRDATGTPGIDGIVKNNSHHEKYMVADFYFSVIFCRCISKHAQTDHTLWFQCW